MINFTRCANSLITGGAGSGKTFTLRAIVDLCSRFRLNWQLVAPTGKAARRIEEATGSAARTIHRLLGYDGRGFVKNAADPIDADVIIVDEVSMVDVRLMQALFAAIDLSRTAVVLVGDPNQLPPVGPGNPLRDLLRAGVVPTTVLIETIRQAGPLKHNCRAVLNGAVARGTSTRDDLNAPWRVFASCGTPEDVLSRLDNVIDQFAELLGRPELLTAVQVMTPTHKGPLGTTALNAHLQRLFQRRSFAIDARVPDGRPAIMPRDKIIQTANDYDLDLMNGWIGFVVNYDPLGCLTADFAGRVVTIAPDKRKNMELAYATSIHKMQGSEFDHALIVALIDAASAGTGKTLLAEVIALIVTGRAADLSTAPRDSDE